MNYSFTNAQVQYIKSIILDNLETENMQVSIIKALHKIIPNSKIPDKIDCNRFYKLYIPDEGYIFIKYLHRRSSSYVCIELWLPTGDSSKGKKDSEGCVRDTQIVFPRCFTLGMVIDKLIEKCIIAPSDCIITIN